MANGLQYYSVQNKSLQQIKGAMKSNTSPEEREESQTGKTWFTSSQDEQKFDEPTSVNLQETCSGVFADASSHTHARTHTQMYVSRSSSSIEWFGPVFPLAACLSSFLDSQLNRMKSFQDVTCSRIPVLNEDTTAGWPE